MIIRRIHFVSGCVLTLFIGVHLLNHSLSLLGPDVHIEVMDHLRIVYRNVVVETLLLIAVFLQIISGVKLFFMRRATFNNSFQNLQLWSGLYLAFFLLIHVGAVMVGRFVLQLDTNFFFGVAGLNTFPLNLFFIPYYAIAIVAFFGHISSIHFQKMTTELFGLSVEQQSKIIIGFGILTTIFIFYGLTNGFTGVQIPEEYHLMIGK